MSAQGLTDYEYAHKRLSYDPETGILTWKEAGPEFFADDSYCYRWNARYANTRAGAPVAGGYRQIFFPKNGKKAPLREHRVIWLMVYGEWPQKEIDHINGDPSDNRIENLREVDRALNMQNRRMHSNNSSGVCGVTFRKADNLWCASIKVHGEKRVQKAFKTKDEAVAHRKYLETLYTCFTDRHGKSSDLGNDG